MSGRKWCEKCGELEAMTNPFPWIPGGEARAHRAGCPGGRVIPIATLCSEPTTIDESDLEPGMVVVTVDDGFSICGSVWLMSTDAVMTDSGIVIAARGEMLDDVSPAGVRRIAGRRRPC